MEITEIRIKLVHEPGERLQAFCSITFDNCFVIRDLKIIEGTSGPFVAMPSRRLTSHCHQCGSKNHLRAVYCNQCGARLKEDRVVRDDEGRAKLYADIAHPINSACREMIQQRVIQAFREEVERSKQPGYVSTYDDLDEDYSDLPPEAERRRPAEPAGGRATRPAVASSAEKTKIEPAAEEPRGPHRPNSTTPTGSTPSKPKRGEFGAGIL